MVQNPRAYSIATPCCYNQMDNVCAGEYSFSYATKTKVELIHNFTRFLPSYDDNAITRKMQKKSPEVAKNRYPNAQGRHLPPWLPA